MKFSDAKRNVEEILDSNPGVVLTHSNQETKNLALAGENGEICQHYLIAPAPGIFTPDGLRDFGLGLFEGSGLQANVPWNDKFHDQFGRLHCGVVEILNCGLIAVNTHQVTRSFEIRDQETFDSLRYPPEYSEKSTDTTTHYLHGLISLRIFPSERLIRAMMGGSDKRLKNPFDLEVLKEYM
jgi:hypothetical protein